MPYPWHTVKTTCEVSSDSNPSIGDTAAAQRMSSNEEYVSGGTVCTQREFWKVTSTAVAIKDHGDLTPFCAGAGDLGEDDVEISFVLIRGLSGPVVRKEPRGPSERIRPQISSIGKNG